MTFPKLKNWQATRQSLHAYSKVVGAVPRALAIFHPKWWHISLKVSARGLVTDTIPLPDGGLLQLIMDLQAHEVQLIDSRGKVQSFGMRAGRSADDLAADLFPAVAAYGLEGEYATEKCASAEPQTYASADAENYWSAMTGIYGVRAAHRSKLAGDLGPLQLWPHGFDLAFEWFGSRKVSYEEHGEVTEYPSQLNLGFSPGEPSHPEPYFYSNPFPFEEAQLLSQPLLLPLDGLPTVGRAV